MACLLASMHTRNCSAELQNQANLLAHTALTRVEGHEEARLPVLHHRLADLARAAHNHRGGRGIRGGVAHAVDAPAAARVGSGRTSCCDMAGAMCSTVGRFGPACKPPPSQPECAPDPAGELAGGGGVPGVHLAAGAAISQVSGVEQHRGRLPHAAVLAGQHKHIADGGIRGGGGEGEGDAIAGQPHGGGRHRHRCACSEGGGRKALKVGQAARLPGERFITLQICEEGLAQRAMALLLLLPT